MPLADALFSLVSEWADQVAQDRWLAENRRGTQQHKTVAA